VIVRISFIDRWARSSQQGARRNAMIASTRLTQRRIEREEVDRYLAGRRTAEDGAARAGVARAASAPDEQVVAGR
jgi:hypothetical protein